jgi:hypothetical protein
VDVGTGTFTLSGGTISANDAAAYGGGVDVGTGTFTLSGGTISGNSAANGGGIASISSTVILSATGANGITISGNKMDGANTSFQVYNDSAAWTLKAGNTLKVSGTAILPGDPSTNYDVTMTASSDETIPFSTDNWYGHQLVGTVISITK